MPMSKIERWWIIEYRDNDSSEKWHEVPGAHFITEETMADSLRKRRKKDSNQEFRGVRKTLTSWVVKVT